MILNQYSKDEHILELRDFYPNQNQTLKQRFEKIRMSGIEPEEFDDSFHIEKYLDRKDIDFVPIVKELERKFEVRGLIHNFGSPCNFLGGGREFHIASTPYTLEGKDKLYQFITQLMSREAQINALAREGLQDRNVEPSYIRFDVLDCVDSRHSELAGMGGRAYCFAIPGYNFERNGSLR